MNRRWYYENRFPNPDYLDYLRQLISESEIVTEIQCAAQVSSVFQYEAIGYQPTFAILRLMKNISVDAKKNDYFIWLSTNCFNHSIHYSLLNNEIEFFENKVLDTHVSSIWIGKLNHELILYGRYKGTLRPFLHQMFTYLSDGEINRPMLPKKREPYTLSIKTNSWKRVMKKKIDQSIKVLIIRCPAVSKFKQHIQKLNNLTVLDLSSNEIIFIPAEFGNLQLRELYLADNCIGSSNNWKWLTGKKICSFLRILDLSKNEIKTCPASIGRLNLIVLNLSDNLLQIVPHSIGRMKQLRCLRVARNRLQFVPEAMFRIPLKYLDLTGNCLNSLEEVFLYPSAENQNVYSLTKFASNCMVRNHLYGGEGTPDTVEEILDDVKRCYCGKPADEKLFLIRRVNCRRLLPIVVYQGPRIFGITVLFYCCSPECYNSLSK